MRKDRYSTYGFAILAGAGVALWAGISPSFLLVVLVCSLMMFFMMRGMHGAQQVHGRNTGHDESGHDESGHDESGLPSRGTPQGAGDVWRRPLDGSHERIDPS